MIQPVSGYSTGLAVFDFCFCFAYNRARTSVRIKPNSCVRPSASSHYVSAGQWSGNPIGAGVTLWKFRGYPWIFRVNPVDFPALSQSMKSSKYLKIQQQAGEL